MFFDRMKVSWRLGIGFGLVMVMFIVMEVLSLNLLIELTAEQQKALNGIYAILGIILFISLILSFLVSRSITRPLRALVDFAGKVAAGDLEAKVSGQYQAEFGVAIGAVTRMVNSIKTAQGDLSKKMTVLNGLLNDVATVSDQVKSGSQQVSGSSQALSQGATQQAASLEEVTSSMTELGSQTRNNAENAGQANLLAKGALDAAQNGNKEMQEMTVSMDDINSSSREIAKIIKVIDDIAFQTNLLALNAAVEAARAGKHGKGFAVVAQEVRNLAGRSAKAAQETAELIEGSMKKVEKGMGIVQTTAAALREIVEAATKVNDLVGDIAAASNEQAQGIAQVNLGLGQIDRVTQHNTSNAEETATAAEELNNLAGQLERLMIQYRGKEQGAAGLGRPPAPPVRKPVGPPPAPAAKAIKRSQPPEGRPDQALRPQDVIALDDKEFGKY